MMRALSGWSGLPAAMLFLAVAATQPARAEDAPGIAADHNTEEQTAAALPGRERALIDLLMKEREQYSRNRASAHAAEVRLDMQVHVIDFMREDQSFENWRGVVKTHGVTPEGDAWIQIEIADGITVGTWQKRDQDVIDGTLARRFSPLFKAIEASTTGQPVVFSGRMVSSLLSSDEEMIMRPQMVARLTALKVPE